MKTAKRLIPTAVCILILAAALPSYGTAQTVTSAATIDTKAVDALIAEQVKTRGLVGVSVAIMQDGRIVLAKGYGVSSLPDHRPVSDETMFAIGSITKQFTSACVLLLAEDGKLSVADKVAKYYPNLTRAGDITLLDLMNHVSGYPDYYPLDFVDRRMIKPIAPDELIRLYGTGKLDFEPGSRYSYSNTGYVLLGRVVEKVSGESFGAVLTRRILKPLGLEHTVYEPDPRDAGLARGFTTFVLSGPVPAEPEAKGWIAAAGAIYATASDLAKWDLALIDGKLLKPESFKLMTRPRKLSDGRTSNYGCGLAVSERAGLTVLSHNGAVAGFLAQNMMVPANRSATVLLSNFDASGDVGALYRQVMATIFPKGPDIPKIAGPPAPEKAKELFLKLQEGAIDRSQFGEEFNVFLTDEMIKGASERLKPYGAPTGAALEGINERGGMEVTTVRLSFNSGSLRALMYRMPDGKVKQFFIYKD
jgi:CubicO group peptidase (beta-lactamase class C family)